jgi:hypothetical protein
MEDRIVQDGYVNPADYLELLTCFSYICLFNYYCHAKNH